MSIVHKLALTLALCLTTGQAIADCSVAATPMAFGLYDPQAGALDSVATITISCSGIILLSSVPYEVQISAGNSGNFNPRAMSDGSDNLNYNLYTSSARTAIWGDGSGVTNTVTGSVPIVLLVGSASEFVYGRLFGGQSVTAGAYTDNPTITVVY